MAHLVGLSSYVPDQIVTNTNLAEVMDTSDEWIQQRAGIRQRHWVRGIKDKIPPLGNCDLAQIAAQGALTDAGVDPKSVDLLVYATLSPDSEITGSAGRLVHQIGLSENARVLEVRNQCSGFLYGLTIAHAHLATGAFESAMVVGSEVHSTGLDVSTRGRGVAVLFGDGAGAALLSRSDPSGPRLKDVIVEADGSYASKLMTIAPGFARTAPIELSDFEGETPPLFPHMDGRFVFKMASLNMPRIVRKILERNGQSLNDLTLVVPHQANQRILDMLGHELGCPEKIFSNIERYGNTTAASIPIALHEAVSTRELSSGDLVVLVTFGAGFSWGAALLEW